MKNKREIIGIEKEKVRDSTLEKLGRIDLVRYAENKKLVGRH